MKKIDNLLNITFFKKFLIIFWALWWFVAFITDILDVIQRFGFVHYSWIYSDNYPFLVKALALYNAPQWVPLFFFAIIIIGSLISSIVFTRAVLLLEKPEAF